MSLYFSTDINTASPYQRRNKSIVRSTYTNITSTLFSSAAKPKDHIQELRQPVIHFYIKEFHWDLPFAKHIHDYATSIFTNMASYRHTLDQALTMHRQPNQRFHSHRTSTHLRLTFLFLPRTGTSL